MGAGVNIVVMPGVHTYMLLVRRPAVSSGSAPSPATPSRWRRSGTCRATSPRREPRPRPPLAGLRCCADGAAGPVTASRDTPGQRTLSDASRARWPLVQRFQACPAVLDFTAGAAVVVSTSSVSENVVDQPKIAGVIADQVRRERAASRPCAGSRTFGEAIDAQPPALAAGRAFAEVHGYRSCSVLADQPVSALQLRRRLRDFEARHRRKAALPGEQCDALG